MKRFLKSLFVALMIIVISVGSGKTINVDAYATPRLMVTGYDIPGGTVKAGEKFKLTLHLRNTQTRTAVSNIKLSLSTETCEFMTASGSDSIYIDKIQAEEDYDVTIDMIAKNDLEVKPYTLTITMDYEDRYDCSFQEIEKLTIPVTKDCKFTITDLNLSKNEVHVGEKASVSLSFNNTGKVNISNISLKVEGEGIESVESYSGSVTSGNSVYLSASLKTVDVCSNKDNVKLIISYEDANGVEKSIEQKATLNIIENEVIEVSPENNSVAQAKNYNIYIAFGVVIVVFIVVVKAIKKRKEDMLDNEID